MLTVLLARSWLLCLASVLLSGVGVVRADEKPCTTHDSGNYYDLGRLSASKDYEFTSYSGQKYVLNVCKPISTEVWSPRVDKPEDVAGYTERGHGGFSMGDVNTTVLFREGNPVILMTDGSPCPSAGSLTASTAIRFVCDSSAGTGTPKMIATLPPDEETACAFFVEWRTEMACPTSEGGVFGTIVSVLAIIAAVVFALYLVGGTLYNRYVLQLRGVDQVPRVSFFSFSDTVEFVRDCVDRIKYRTSDAWQSGNWGAPNWSSGGGSWGGSGRGGYGGLRSTPEEAQTMLGGPPGWLDEQDEEDDEEAARQTPPAPAHTEDESRPSGMDQNGVIRL
ncbi:mannose-6-phosphate receptor binding domain-containing protein [Dichomitus squalens]|uniref:Mannose-6-phosphate receptor binding domain-containing protein n=1 Tax=Dichomitus squalens TaxID=114155 RepID=A0A4Q9Q4W2_9APHY|nr:mannose-6-phosphate receptor binding domain-containing protein [Dichomitus squalens]